MSSTPTVQPPDDADNCFRKSGHLPHAEAAAYAWGELGPGRAADTSDRWKACPECFLRVERARAMRMCCNTGNHIQPEDAADLAAGRMFPMDRVHAMHERANRCPSCDGIVTAAVHDLTRPELANAYERQARDFDTEGDR